MKQIFSYPRIARDWLLANQPYLPARDDHQRPLVFFVLCIVFYAIYLLFMQGDWVMGGEMWAEAASNYYPASISSSLKVKFLTVDTGYVPLPQRIIAAFGHQLGLPVKAIPYFYTWSAIVCSAAMIGAFCLAPFRALARNDLLRLFAAIAVLMVADFESRTFINFTYFVAYFVAIVTALAFVERNNEVPVWSWAIPILMVSKPAVLAALPAMVLVAFFSKARFRLITVATVILCLAQILNMFLNPGKVFLGVGFYGPLDCALATIQYFFGFLSVLLLGVSDYKAHYKLFAIGFGLLLLCVFVVWKRRTNAGALILTGLLLLLFNVAVHCFAFSGVWNIELERLTYFELERHIIVGYGGITMIVVGFIVAAVEAKHTKIAQLGPLLFLAWFIFSGWFTSAASLSKSPGFPLLNSSQWQMMSDSIASDQAICVPADPMGMMFHRNCTELNGIYMRFLRRKGFLFNPMPGIADRESVLELQPPEGILERNLISLAVLVKPQMQNAIPINAEASLKLKDGSIKHLVGYRQLPASGGMVMMAGQGMVPIKDIQTVSVRFNNLVDLGLIIEGDGKTQAPVIMWMGN